jgi:8-oxo-dGTP pyrophosphatase MutT (NUDIX family)
MPAPPRPADFQLLPYEGRGDDPPTREGGFLAAVAIILREARHPGSAQRELELLLIRRSTHERDPWSGQMALPGGRMDPGDDSLLVTAIRETREETRVDLHREARLLGRLTEVAPRARELPVLTVLPFVFELEGGARAVPASDEVSEVVWAPMSRFLDPGTRATHRHTTPEGELLVFPAFDVRGRIVWGMTHRILEDLLSRLTASGTSAEPGKMSGPSRPP